MQIHSNQTISKLKFLRKSGYSIEALMRELSLPKSTVWHHIHKIKLSDKYKKILKSNQGGSKLRKEKDLLRAHEEAKNLLESHDKYLYTTAASLYWAEGSKGRCELVNTDGEMIKLYLKILRNNLKIPEERIEPILRIFSNHKESECLNYWSEITRIPKNRFTVLINDGGNRGRGYGMCRIIVRKGGYTLKLFKAIISEICK